MLFLLVAFNLHQVTPRPVKRVMLEPVGKIDLGECVGVKRCKCYLLAPPWGRVLQLLHNKPEDAVQ